MQFPITIGLHRSRFLDSVLLAIASLCGLGMLVYPQPLAMRSVLLVAAGVVSVIAWRRLTPQLSALRLEWSGRISLLPCGSDEFIEASLLAGATVHQRLVVARLKTMDNRCYALFVTTDSMNPQDFRRLRLYLRWRADFSELGGGA